MKNSIVALVAGALLASASTAGAAPPVVLHTDGMTGAEVAKWLKDAGHKAELGTDKAGDPMIKSAAGDVNYSIYFYDCEAKPRCRAIQFSAGFDVDEPITAAKLNEWNRANRYLKAYLDEEGDPHVEYDVNVNAGRTKEGLDDDFSIWTSMIEDFTDFIDW